MFGSISLMGQTKEFQIYLPNGNKPSSPLPLTLYFHDTKSKICTLSDDTGHLVVQGSGVVNVNIDANIDSIDVFNKTYGASQIFINILLQSHDAEMDPVTVTGTFVRKSVSQNPYNIRVIGKQKITEMAAQNLSDVLQNESNIQVNQDAILGSSAIMQGIGGNGLKILLNGIPLIGRLNGNIDLSQIPMQNVERIEIIEGPMSVIYGSDALGGIINIITKEPMGKKHTARAHVFADNISNYNIDAQIDTRISKSLPLSISMGRQFFGGKDFNETDRLQDWKPKTKYFGDINTIYKYKNISLRLGSNFFREELLDRSNAEKNLYTWYGYNSMYYSNRWDNQMQLNIKIDDYNHFQMQNAYNLFSRQKQTKKRDLVTGEENTYRPQDQDTTRFNLFNSRGVYVYKSPSLKLNLNVGYDFTREMGDGKRIPVDNPGITDFAAFVAADLHPNSQWSIQPSLRIVNNSRYGSSIIKNYGGKDNGYAPIIPSLQFKYSMSKHLVFRASYSKGYRAPSIKELFFNFVDINHNVHGNEDLSPETSDNFILSMDYRHRLSNTSFTNFNFSIFNNNVKNKISLGLIDAPTNYYTYINVGRFKSQGINVKFDFKTERYNFKFSNTLLSVIDQIVSEDSILNQNYLNYQATFNFGYNFKNKNNTLNLISRYTSPTFGYNNDLSRYKIGGYYLMDLIFAGNFMKKKFEYQIGVKNILGTTTVNSTRANGGGTHDTNSGDLLITPGRIGFISLGYTFN